MHQTQVQQIIVDFLHYREEELLELEVVYLVEEVILAIFGRREIKVVLVLSFYY